MSVEVQEEESGQTVHVSEVRTESADSSLAHVGPAVCGMTQITLQSEWVSAVRP